MATATVFDPRLLESTAFKLPADYVTLPENYHPSPERFVGLLSCQMNPLLRSLDSIITRIEKKLEPTPSKGAKSKKKTTGELEWEIEFKDTVIFPEGGGQPCDHGTLTLKSGSSPQSHKIQVVDAFRRKLNAVHVVHFPSSMDPVANGWAIGAEVHMEVDWRRRTYHMQQHTGQHVLSAVFEHELKNDTVGWMLSQTQGQPSYVDLKHPPTNDDVALVVRRCNEVIQAATRVRVSVRLDSDHERPSTLPEDYVEGVIRYITIDGLDTNPCCGTHHPSLAFIGSLFIFPGVTKVTGPARYRIFFVAGEAVLQSLAANYAVVKDVSGTLECGAADVVERLSQLQKAKKDGLNREKVLKTEAIRTLVQDLAFTARDINTVQISHLHREEASTDIDFLSLIIYGFQPPAEKTWLTLLSSGPFPGTAGTGGCLLIAGSDEALVKKSGELVKTKFQGRVKGGGGKGRWQGKLLGNWEKGDRDLFGQILEEAVA